MQHRVAEEHLPTQRRSLSAGEKQVLGLVMKKRNMTQSQVMDELGLPRLDASLWMAVRRGTAVSPEMLERLLSWLRGNRRLWDPRVGPSGRGAGH